MTKIHIAGLCARVGSQQRQRCAWCGEVIDDTDLASIAVALNPDGSVPDVSGGFEIGVLVAVSDGNPRCTYIVRHEDGAQLPAGWCGDDGKPKLRAV